MPAGLVETALAGNGLLGVGLVALALWCMKLQRRLEEVQDQRVSDAQRVGEQLLAMSERTGEASRALAVALDAQTQSIEALGRHLDYPESMPHTAVPTAQARKSVPGRERPSALMSPHGRTR